MTAKDQEKWDNIYRSNKKPLNQAARVLTDFLHLLPETGMALDLACGRGANAVLLAGHGLLTHAWDISEHAISSLRESCLNEKVDIVTEQRDVVLNPPAAESFDVIVVSRFLDRTIIDSLINALRKDGLIYYQTFILDCFEDVGPRNPAYRLANNELLKLFSSLRILYYHEEGTTGRKGTGFRNEAMLIARKQ